MPMEKNIQTSRQIWRFQAGEPVRIDDPIAREQPVTLKINGEEFATLVCTPTYLEEMAIGFLVSEGLIQAYEEVKTIWIDDRQGFIHIELVRPIDRLHQHLQTKRYMGSCCGMSRQGFVFASDAKTARKVQTRDVKLNAGDCFRLMAELQENARTFQQTGGVHNAALATKDGLLLMREDVGRHNALDKLYGHCLQNGLSLHGKLVVFSGRLSAEIILKVAKIGCELVLSKSAPTDRALQIAEELDITTVGFIRNRSMNVYTVPERIELKS